jgi:hypothetical protein
MIIKAETGRPAALCTVEKLDLRTMQHLVGGLIQPVVLDDDRCTLWCDEEGKPKRKQFNMLVPDQWGNEWDIVGDFFICGEDEDGDAVGLTAQQATKWLTLLHNQE